jgi:hypothetical protein
MSTDFREHTVPKLINGWIVFKMEFISTDISVKKRRNIALYTEKKYGKQQPVYTCHIIPHERTAAYSMGKREENGNLYKPPHPYRCFNSISPHCNFLPSSIIDY